MLGEHVGWATRVRPYVFDPVEQEQLLQNVDGDQHELLVLRLEPGDHRCNDFIALGDLCAHTRTTAARRRVRTGMPLFSRCAHDIQTESQKQSRTRRRT